MKLQITNKHGMKMEIAMADQELTKVTDQITMLVKMDAQKSQGILVYFWQGEWRVVPHPLSSDGLVELSCMEWIAASAIKEGIWLFPGTFHQSKIAIVP